MYRTLVIGSVLLWVVAMSLLVRRDVWPAWTAQDAPPLTQDQLATLQQRQEQYGIFRGDSVRLGTAWADISSPGGRASVSGAATFLFAPFPEILIKTETEFDTDGGLDSFKLNVFGIPNTAVRVLGERRGIYFPCQLQIGPVDRQANLELSSSRLIGDTLRPFAYLPTLKVGQSWRMQLLDPFAAVVGRGTQFTSIVAKVTSEETIEHLGQQVTCKVVETSPQHVKAWVGPDGRVLLQEAELPVVGKIRVREEKYDGQMKEAAIFRLQYPRQARKGDGD